MRARKPCLTVGIDFATPLAMSMILDGTTGPGEASNARAPAQQRRGLKFLT